MAQYLSMELPSHAIDTTRFEGHLGVGLKDSGKSALGERIAELHQQKGFLIFDGLDGSDWESAYWGIAGPSGNFYKTLLVIPPWYEVKGPNPEYSHIKPISSDVGLETILKTAKEEDRIVTVGCRLWRRGTVGNVLKDWLCDMPDAAERVDIPIFILMREVGSYAFSQLKIFPELEDEFRRALIFLFRHARHFGIGFYFDAHRLVDLIKGVRVLCDHTHLKKCNTRMIPPDLNWLSDHIEEQRQKIPKRGWKLRDRTYPRLTKLYPQEFYSISQEEIVHPVVRFKMATFHHKRPRDNFLKRTGFYFKYLPDIEQKYTEELKKAKAPKREQVFRFLAAFPTASNIEVADYAECDPSYVAQIKGSIRKEFA